MISKYRGKFGTLLLNSTDPTRGEFLELILISIPMDLLRKSYPILVFSVEILTENKHGLLQTKIDSSQTLTGIRRFPTNMYSNGRRKDSTDQSQKIIIMEKGINTIFL